MILPGDTLAGIWLMTAFIVNSDIMRQNDPQIFTFPDTEHLASILTVEILNLVKNSMSTGRRFNIALSGGSTPRILFEHIAKFYKDPGIWDNVSFYWVDERCVHPDHPESNFRMANEIFLCNLPHPNEQVFRMKGEEDPHLEANRYSRLIFNQVHNADNLPAFNLIMLGLGGDGHTASIFPGQLELLWTDNFCDVGVHPGTGQKRITLTGKVINNAENVFFLVSGREKAKMVARIICEGSGKEELPATFINPEHGNLSWFLDEAAASLLHNKENPG
jgi:6-phosphogluconolactonase